MARASENSSRERYFATVFTFPASAPFERNAAHEHVKTVTTELRARRDDGFRLSYSVAIDVSIATTSPK